MTKCQQCQGRAQSFLCSTCERDLKRMLVDLRWWIDRLVEAMTGQARLGELGRRTQRTSDLNGEAPADMGDPVALQRRFLAAGGVNARASDLLADVQNTLTTIVRDLLEARGVAIPSQLATARRTDPVACQRMAAWLGEHTGAISAGEDAGQTYRDVKRLSGSIEHAVNRPRPLRACGPCPAPHEERPWCGRALLARNDKREIVCPACQTTHNVEDLISNLIAAEDDKRFTVRELVDVVLPRLDLHVPRRTLYHWIATGKLAAVSADGFTVRRAGGEDDLMVRLADVRALRAQRPRKVSA